jgi:hypothetical protein
VNSDQFEIRKIDFPQELFALEKIWRELEEPVTLSNLGSSFAIVSQSWQALSSDKDHLFGYNREPVILLVSQNGIPVAIAPFIKVHRDKSIGPFTKQLTCIEFFAHSLVARHIRFFYDIVTKHPSAKLTQAVLDWLYKNEKFDVLHLAYISEESKNFSSVASNMLISLTSSVVCPKDFSDFEEYRSRVYSESLKQNLRTGLNRAHARSLKVDVSMSEANSNSLAEVAEFARGKLDSGAYFESGYSRFLMQSAINIGADVAIVRANDRPIAYRVYLRFPGGRFEVDTHRSLDYIKLELGSLLIDCAVKDCFAKNLSVHCEGLYGGIHTERFASKYVRAYKWLSPGNSLIGGITERAVRGAHQVEYTVLPPPSERQAKIMPQ